MLRSSDCSASRLTNAPSAQRNAIWLDRRVYGWIDVLQVGEGLPRGTYTVRVRVIGREHKPNASHFVNFAHAACTSRARFPSGSPIQDPMTSASVIAPYVSALSGG